MHETHEIPQFHQKFDFLPKKHNFCISHWSWNTDHGQLSCLGTYVYEKYTKCCSWLQSKNIDLRMLHILCCIWYASMIEFTFYRIFSPKKSQRGLSISLSRLNLGKFLQESSEDRKWWIDRDWSSAPDSHRLGQIAPIRLRTSPIAWLIISSST